MTKELIEKIEDAYRRVRKIGPDAIYETELREVLRAAADALEAATRERDAALAAIERVRAIIKVHVDYQLNREAKFGRTGTACVCEQCQILAALDGAPEPEEKP